MIERFILIVNVCLLQEFPATMIIRNKLKLLS